MTDCIFCAIVSGDAPSDKVYDDDGTLAFLDINPAADGHVLVIPKEHVADVWDVSPDTATAVMASTLKVAGMIKASLAPDGLNLFQANGPAGWQTVFHFHVHVVPRNFGDPLPLPWDPANPPGDRAKIPEIAAQIRASL